MFKRLLFVFALVSLVFVSYCLQSSFAEDITITTYYPSPYGSYNELATNKLAVDVNGVAVPTEYAAMNNGDAHIGRSLIVGAGGGSGYAYDEVATPPADGTLLVKGNTGIGTNNPGSTRLVVRGPGNTGFTSALNVTKNDGTSSLFVRDDGFVGIGPTGVALWY